MRLPTPLRSLTSMTLLTLALCGSAMATAVVGGGSGRDQNGNGDAVDWTVTPGSFGCSASESPGFRYSYTFTAASDSVHAIVIPLVNAGDVCRVRLPNEQWHFSIDDNDLIFYVDGVRGEGFPGEIEQGSSLGGFGFDSDFDFKKADFTFVGSDGLMTVDPPIPNSPTTGLSLPGSAALALMGIGLLAAAKRRRQRLAIASSH